MSENRGGTTIFVYSSPAQEFCLRRGFYISLGIKISESQDGGKGEYYEKNEWIWNDGKKRHSSSDGSGNGTDDGRLWRLECGRDDSSG